MHIAYLVNQYPGISHTFIRREIAALERAGVSVARFAVRPSRQEIFSPEDNAEAVRTRHIVTENRLLLAAAILRSLFAAPVASLSAMALAAKMGWRSEAGLLRHAIYWAEGMALADWLNAAKLRHVHAHFGTNSATVAMLAAHISGASFSITVHGPEEFDKPALISLKEKIEASRFVCAVSSYGMSQLRRLVAPQFWDRIKIVRCGVEESFYAGAAKPLAGSPRFVSVGRLCEQKGQLTLIEAAAKLKERGHDFSITLVGDGEMRQVLEKAAASLNVRDRIVFAGWKSPAEVRAEIEGARVFVLPSYAEGLPVSIMEAFCLERPVISTYVAGIPELVIPGENGWLAPAGDAESLAQAMADSLAISDEQILQMGRSGKARTKRDHDIDTIALGLKALFEEALKVGAER
ncbi:MAG: glycosyltransferase [Parvularculaceae bacterium]|nr:glycosyltransferase [Amphiplicatus sp.]HRX38119.1 glycosyltransferase [Parvularculaceae bacterium]